MFDPIKASKEIKDSYIDYITTTFDMADTDYEREFRKELQTDGMVASGPFLDIGGSYETGHTLRELIQAQKASVLFERLEPVAEKERELKLDRPLYQHQETAMLKADKGEIWSLRQEQVLVKQRVFCCPLSIIYCESKKPELFPPVSVQSSFIR